MLLNFVNLTGKDVKLSENSKRLFTVLNILSNEEEESRI